MADTTRHVVLTNPGDLLLISGVGQLPDGALEEVTDFFIAAGLKVAVFEEVIQVGSLREWELDMIREAADG